MYKHIINRSIICKHRHNLVHAKAIVTIHTVETAVLTTETTQHTLQLSTIKCPIAAMFVHIVFKHSRRFLSERVKVLSMSILAHVDDNPIRSGLVVWISIADE